MIPIQPPIKRGQQGPEVANLQEALLFMLDKQTLNIKPDPRFLVSLTTRLWPWKY